MINIKDLIITQPSLEQILSAYPCNIPESCKNDAYEFATMSMFQQETDREKALLKCLLQPCSFGQAMMMMEKGALVKHLESALIFKLDIQKELFIFKENVSGNGGGWMEFHDFVEFFAPLIMDDLTKGCWRYAPWFNDGVVDQDVKDFCYEILGVKND